MTAGVVLSITDSSNWMHQKPCQLGHRHANNGPAKSTVRKTPERLAWRLMVTRSLEWTDPNPVAPWPKSWAGSGPKLQPYYDADMVQMEGRSTSRARLLCLTTAPFRSTWVVPGWVVLTGAACDCVETVPGWINSRVFMRVCKCPRRYWAYYCADTLGSVWHGGLTVWLREQNAAVLFHCDRRTTETAVSHFSPCRMHTTSQIHLQSCTACLIYIQSHTHTHHLPSVKHMQTQPFKWKDTHIYTHTHILHACIQSSHTSHTNGSGLYIRNPEMHTA